MCSKKFWINLLVILALVLLSTGCEEEDKKDTQNIDIEDSPEVNTANYENLPYKYLGLNKRSAFNAQLGRETKQTEITSYIKSGQGYDFLLEEKRTWMVAFVFWGIEMAVFTF